LFDQETWGTGCGRGTLAVVVRLPLLDNH